jgi:hypothetical protein
MQGRAWCFSKGTILCARGKVLEAVVSQCTFKHLPCRRPQADRLLLRQVTGSALNVMRIWGGSGLLYVVLRAAGAPSQAGRESQRLRLDGQAAGRGISSVARWALDLSRPEAVPGAFIQAGYHSLWHTDDLSGRMGCLSQSEVWGCRYSHHTASGCLHRICYHDVYM